MNHARFVLCFAIAATVLFGTTVSAQVSSGTHIRIREYDPKNPIHATIADAARIMCLSKYRERMEAGSSAAKTEDLVTALFKEAIDEAGICAHNLSYDSSVYQMRIVTNMDDSVTTIISSSVYKATRKESARVNTAKCTQVKFRDIAEIIADPVRMGLRNGMEMPETILDTHLFCMSLLGKQSGVAAAMNYFRITLN